MSNRLDEVVRELERFNIDPDQYRMWKDNIVTQRFMLEVERDLLETQADYSLGSATIEGIAMRALKNGAHCEVLEVVLEWKPKELEVD